MVQLAIRGFRVASLLLAGYWLLLFVATHIPKPPALRMQHSDKVMHLVAYAGLAFLLCWAFPKDVKKPRAHLWAAWFVAVCYGAMDELSQIPVGRHADVWDWCADSVGALIGLLAYCVAKHLWIRFGHKITERSGFRTKRVHCAGIVSQSQQPLNRDLQKHPVSN